MTTKRRSRLIRTIQQIDYIVPEGTDIYELANEWFFNEKYSLNSAHAYRDYCRAGSMIIDVQTYDDLSLLKTKNPVPQKAED